MQVVIVAGFAVWGGIDGYKYAKKKGFTGWKKAGAIAGGAIIGAVPVGKVFKGAKVIAKSTKVVKKAKIIKKVKKPKKVIKKKKSTSKNKKTSSSVPNHVYTILNQIKKSNGVPPKGYKGGSAFLNDGRGGGQILPKNTTYLEYDVKPYIKGQNRGSERLVIGKNGSIYYPNNHYKTFIRL